MVEFRMWCVLNLLVNHLYYRYGSRVHIGDSIISSMEVNIIISEYLICSSHKIIDIVGYYYGASTCLHV